MPNKAASRAASVLGSIRTVKKSAASRRNGRLGGRPSSGLASVREFRRNLRALGLDRTSIRSCAEWLLVLRSECLRSPCPLRALDYWRKLHPDAAHVAKCLYRQPTLF